MRVRGNKPSQKSRDNNGDNGLAVVLWRRRALTKSVVTTVKVTDTSDRLLRTLFVGAVRLVSGN